VRPPAATASVLQTPTPAHKVTPSPIKHAPLLNPSIHPANQQHLPSFPAQQSKQTNLSYDIKAVAASDTSVLNHHQQ
jgi:hypothetical protein